MFPARRKEIIETLLLSPLYLHHLDQRERLNMVRHLEQQGMMPATAGDGSELPR